MGDDKYFDVGDVEYTLDEVEVFVNCIMSNNLDTEYVLKCLTAIALNLELSEEERPMSEDGEDGEVETWETSDFIDFIDESLCLLLHDENTRGWIKLYRDTLILQEQYITLHKLKLEDKWKF